MKWHANGIPILENVRIQTIIFLLSVFFIMSPILILCCEEIITSDMIKWQQVYFFASIKSLRRVLATSFRFFLHHINILAALLWFIKSSSQAAQSLGRGPMWVKQGSSRLVNAFFVETNLAQSLTLSVLEEDGENFLHIRVRITFAWGPCTVQWKWGELGAWLFVIITRDKGGKN